MRISTLHASHGVNQHVWPKPQPRGTKPAAVLRPKPAAPVFGAQTTGSTSLQALHNTLKPLLEVSAFGFPVALLRSELIEAELPQAFYPTTTLQQTFKTRSLDSMEGLLSRFVKSPVEAYLTAYLVALESVIASTGFRKFPEFPGLSTRIAQGIADANAITQWDPLDAPEFYRTRVDDRLFRLVHSSPKVALHEHQRGAAPLSLIRAGFIRDNNPNAELSTAQLQEFSRVDRLYSPDGKGPLYQPGLPKFLEKYNAVAKKAILNNATAYLASYIYTLNQALDNVRYFEYRFNPMTGGDPMVYTKIIQQGVDDARAFLWETRRQKIDANFIFSGYRMNLDYDYAQKQPEQARKDRVNSAMAVLEAAIQARQAGFRVTGFDITGDEENFAITDFAPLAERLKAYNRTAPYNKRIGATIHAGETPVSGRISHPNALLTGAQSVRKAIELFSDRSTPLRIGHGVQMIHDPQFEQLAELCRKKRIGFEQCPKSNVQTGAVGFYPSLPTLTYLNRKLLVSMSTDNRTLHNSSSTNELLKVSRYLGAVEADRRQLQMNGIRTAFLFDWTQKRALIRDMIRQYQALEAHPESQEVMRLERTNGFKFNKRVSLLA